MASKTTDASATTDETAPWYADVLASIVDAGRRLTTFLTHSSMYLVFIAVAEVATVHTVLSIGPTPAPAVVGLVAYAVYAGDRITDAERDERTCPDRSAFVARHQTLLSITSAGAYGVAIALAVTGGPLTVGITLVPGGFWILYASEWFPTLGARCKRLKRVFVVNSTLVATAWALAVVGLPVAFANATVTPLVVVVFTYFLVDTFVNTEIPNVRDVDADAEDGVDTLPVVLGVRRTRHVLYGIDVLLITFVGTATLTSLLSLSAGVAILVGLGYALVLAWFVGRTEALGRLSIACEAKHLVVFGILWGLTAIGV
jgi:4-hydroxybenzoate polyprenyltransferase